MSIQNRLNQTHFSGVVSIRNQDTILIEECQGYRNYAEQLRINIDTRFGIASGTKLFTALGIMCLVERGKLSLKDPLSKHVTYPFPSYDPAVTIEHLLTHTSGLPDYFDEDEGYQPPSVPWYDLKKPSDYLAIMPHKPMKFEPGTSFNYNNSAFVFLAIIIEYITGDYHEFIDKEILQKANMTNSGFFYMNDVPNNTALGYIDPSNAPTKTNIFDLPIVGGGDGGLFTTAPDMHRFWGALREGLIVSNDTYHQMITPHSKTEHLSYGLGVWLEDIEGTYHPFIMGQDPGVSFQSGYDIDTLETYVIVSNTEQGVWPIVKEYKQSK
jgi:CubicO group peptidase (beta-lactamase class C family)